MKIPKRIKVGAIWYRVRFKEIEDGTCGTIDRNKNTITLSEDLATSQKETTFIHEIFHAIDGELKADKIDLLANMWHQVLKDNKLWK